MEAIINLMKKLTTQDLIVWAGDRVYDRGQSYIRRVDQIFWTEDGSLASWVFGSSRYATMVRIHPDLNLSSFCTCPYTGSCKHAVALVLAAAESIKKSLKFKLLDPDNPLHDELFSEMDMDEEDDIDADEEVYEEEAEPVPIREKPSKKTNLETILNKKTKTQLITLLLSMADRFPEIEQDIRDAYEIATTPIDRLIRGIRKDIRDITRELVEYDYRTRTFSRPDYNRIEMKFQELLDAGYADALLELGTFLFNEVYDQLESAQDEGETIDAVSLCLSIVIDALPKSSLTPPEQILWIIDRQMMDDFGIMGLEADIADIDGVLPEHWVHVAHTLENRLKPSRPDDESLDVYSRVRLSKYLITAYRLSGMPDKIIPFLEKEVEQTMRYDMLIDTLIDAGELDKARQWCIRGIHQSSPNELRLPHQLQERLHKIAEKEERWDLIAAYHADAFFARPSLSTYSALQKATDPIGLWPAVRVSALKYIENHQRPDTDDARKAGHWPLPKPEFTEPEESRPAGGLAWDMHLLLQIAIQEHRVEDALLYYENLKKITLNMPCELEQNLAQLVSETHPDISLEIWRKSVYGYIARVNADAYREAGRILISMQKVYTKTNRLPEYIELIKDIRTQHKAKRRLMEVLDNLSGKKLI